MLVAGSLTAGTVSRLANEKSSEESLRKESHTLQSVRLTVSV